MSMEALGHGASELRFTPKYIKKAYRRWTRWLS